MEKGLVLKKGTIVEAANANILDVTMVQKLLTGKERHKSSAANTKSHLSGQR